jgi:hypothetical protein
MPQVTSSPFCAVAVQLFNAVALLLLVAVAWLLSNAVVSLLLVDVAWLLLTAFAVLLFLALALLLLSAVTELSLVATAWEVESEKQLLSPFCTLVSPLLLTHTSPPWARATPEKRAIIAAIIAAAVNTNRMRLIDILAFPKGGVISPA